jgi:hypothetical protein
MVGLFVWLLRLSHWPGVRLPFGSAPAAQRDETAAHRPHPDGDRAPASFTDLALGALAERVALLCLALLIAARLGAHHSRRDDRPGLAPARSQDAPRGPPPSR